MRMIAMKEAPNKRDETDSSFCHVEAAVIDVEREESFPPAGTGQRPEKATFFLFVVTRFRGGPAEQPGRFDAKPPSRIRSSSGTNYDKMQTFARIEQRGTAVHSSGALAYA